MRFHKLLITVSLTVLIMPWETDQFSSDGGSLRWIDVLSTLQRCYAALAAHMYAVIIESDTVTYIMVAFALLNAGGRSNVLDASFRVRQNFSTVRVHVHLCSDTLNHI